jgi:DnaJ-class molecular chaperone
MSLRDHRKTLGVSENATPDEIKAAYRTLAKKYHPDANQSDPEAERKFREATDAYKALKDASSGKPNDSTFGSAFDDDISDFANSEIFNTIFDVMRQRGYGNEDYNFFGRQQAWETNKRAKVSGAPIKGEDRDMEVDVGLDEAFTGTEKVIEIAPGERIKVKIPSGVLHGARVRVRGHGSKGRDGGADGDLYLVLSVREHDRFRLDGQNLHVEFEVPFTVAALGGTIEYIHLDGEKHVINLRPFPKGETTLVSKGKGWPERTTASTGHLLIHLKAILPDTLTDRQRRLMEELSETSPSYKSDRMATSPV